MLSEGDNGDKIEPKKICAVSIVKNESKIIERCLNSMLPIIDMVSIVDTGSTDNTVEIIENWLVKNNIPGKVHIEPFRNFGYNRTHSFQIAKETFPEADYALLLDADMILQVNGKFDKRLLFESSYLVNQFNTHIIYANIRLVSMKYNWVSRMRTHEYWGARVGEEIPAGSPRPLSTLIIDDREDGGSKADKFIRDERLLKEEIEDPEVPGPDKVRAHFYLAQTYGSLGKFEESNVFYRKRIDLGGFREEIYIAHVRIINNNMCIIERLKKEMKNSDSKKEYEERIEALRLQSKEMADNSVKIVPERSEALYYYGDMCLDLYLHEDAYDYLSKCRKISFPSNSTLFVEKDIYYFLVDFKLNVCCYYIGAALPADRDEEKERVWEEGKNAGLRVLANKNVPDLIKNRVKKNQGYYL